MAKGKGGKGKSGAATRKANGITKQKKSLGKIGKTGKGSRMKVELPSGGGGGG